MITLEQFTKLMVEFKKLQDDEHAVHDAMQKLSPDFGGFYLSRYSELFTRMIKMLTGDGDADWIGYYIYELEWGKKYHKGCITDNKKKDIPLKTIKDLYNIIKNKDI
jgi:hypothetical protein